MPRLEWTPSARRDLDDIFDYIAENDNRPSTAAKILREINSKAEQYSHHPLMGTARPDLGDYRSFNHKRYVVLYVPLDDGIEVHAVVDASRDFRSLFPPVD